MVFPARRIWIGCSFVLLVAGAVTAYVVVSNRHAAATLRAAERALERRDFGEAGRLLEEYLESRPADHAVRLLAARAARCRADYSQAKHHLRLCEQAKGHEDGLALERDLIALELCELGKTDRLLSFGLEDPGAKDTLLVLEAVIESGLRVLETSYIQDVAVPQAEQSRRLARVQTAVDSWMQGPHSHTADRVQGLVWRGRLLLMKDDYWSAKAALEEALKLDPDHFDARKRLAGAVTHEAPQEAAAHLEKLHQAHPDNAQVRHSLAGVLRQLGRLEEARRLLDDLLAADPENVAYLKERGELALDEQQREVAERYLRQALLRAPNDPEINLALSRALPRDREAEAKLYWERFRQLDEARRQRQSGSPPSNP